MAEARRLRPVETAEEGKSAEAGRSVSKSHLVNRLNYLNFQDQTVLVNLRHLIYDNAIFLRARPLPCAGERLDLVWAETAGLKELLKTYRVDYLLIPDGKKCLLVSGEMLRIDNEGVSCILPVSGHEFQARRIKRHSAEGVSVQLIQYGAKFHGDLVDFTPIAVRVKGKPVPPATFLWFNQESPVNLRLVRGESVIYSGAFEIVSQSWSDSFRSLVLRQVQGSISRFKSKKQRNLRQQLVPSPNIVFDHPLIGKRINLKVGDLSGSGFSVEENEGDSVLLPGMMIPELKINFAQGMSLSCRAQVVFRNVTGEGPEKNVKCGVALLDMDIRDHVKLLSMLHQVANRRSYVGTEVDLDDLWDFFFETGFIYPGKYLRFQANKEEIKKTYARLYGDNPQIARHFIYQDRGAILGHMAMVRFYHNSWMVHHHAARKSVTIKAGLAVLDQVSRYLNELGNFSFAHLNYVYCYYRPDNKFPNRVFGGFVRQYPEPRARSLDSFAFSHHTGRADRGSLPPPWELSAGTPFDLGELASFYRQASGGLMTEAFDLLPTSADPEILAQEYRSLGFKKERFCYALRKDGSLKAFLLVNCTDAGFNMADLTNCVTLIVLDEELPREFAEIALDLAARHYEGGEMPVLTFPESYLDRHFVPYEKTYMLWILNMQYSDPYLEYCQGFFRSVKSPPEG